MILTPFANFNYSSITKVKTAFTEYNSLIEQSSLKQASYATAVGSTNKSLGAYLSQLGASKASMSGYLGYLVSTKAATIGTTIATKTLAITIGVLKAAANMAIVTLASWVIEKAIEGIQNLANADQNAIDKAKELTSAYQNNAKTINTNISTLQGLKSEFSKLSKGVDENGTNIGLSTNEYKQYHDVVKQIVDIDPQLIKGYDDENNAIIDKNTALQKAIDYESQELELKKQQQVYGQSGNDLFQGAVSSKNQANNSGNEIAKDLLSMSDQTKTAFNDVGLDTKKILSGNIDELKKAASQQDVIFANAKKQGEITSDEDNELKKLFSDVQAVTGQIDTSNNSFLNLAHTFMSLKENSNWASKINESGALQAFDKQIQNEINKGNINSKEELYSKTKEIGEEFEKIKDQIPFKEIADLKQQYNTGAISADKFNQELNIQIAVIEKLVSAHPELKAFLDDLISSYKDFADNASKNTDFADTLKDIGVSLSTVSSKITDYAKNVKDLNDAIDIQNKGDLLTGEQVSVLISKYPELTKSIIDTGNGYKFKAGALEEVRKEEINEQTTAVNAAIADAQNTINSVTSQINAYSSLIGAIKSVADAKRALAGLEETASGASSKNHIMLKDSMGTSQYNEVSKARSLLNKYIDVSGQLEEDQDKLNALKKSAELVGQNNYEKVDNSGYKASQKAGEKSGEKAAKSATDAAKKAAEALKDEYEAELKVIEYRKQMDQYPADKNGVEGYKYFQALSDLYAKWSKTDLDLQDKQDLQTKVYEADKSYEESLLQSRYKRIDQDIKMGKYEENSITHVRSLCDVQDLLNSKSATLVNTKEKQLEIQDKIYDAEKAHAENVITASYDQLQHRESMGLVGGDRRGNYSLQNLQEIQRLIEANKAYLGVEYSQKQIESEEKIYAQKKKNLETDISDVETQIQLGELQSGSLEQISKLSAIKSEIDNSSWLNRVDKEDYQIQLEEKLLEARKSYIQNLESSLSDENIVGSYGYRIKQIQDQIDAINNQADAQSKELAIEKAKAAWEEAKNQKSISVFHEGRGFVYEQDTTKVNDAKEKLSDAERAKQIEDLTKQKDQIQKDENAIKKQLEDSLKTLEGSNNQSWSNIANQIDDVLGKVVVDVSDAAEQNESSWNEQDEVLGRSTEKQKNDYRQQESALRNHLNKIAPLLAKFTSLYTSAYQSINNMADAMIKLGNAYVDTEQDRENANYRYYEYNAELRRNGNTVKYASGTDYSKQGWANTDENGFEMKLKPISSGQYTWLNEGSKVLTADMTKNLEAWSKYNPQTMVLKAMSNDNHVGSNVTNNHIIDSGTTINQNFPNAKFDIQSDSGTQLMNELSNLDLDTIQHITKN